MPIEGRTHVPTIIESQKGNYVIVGSVDHGMEIPEKSVTDLIKALGVVEALAMETPESQLLHMQPMSTELLTKASVGSAPIHYLSGNRMDEEIGGTVLKYVRRELAEVFVPAIYLRNSRQMGQKISFESTLAFLQAYKGRFGFLDPERALRYLQQLANHQELSPGDLDEFSYDFEKFIGDVREYEWWLPELKEFKAKYHEKIAACVGDYHVPFVQAVFDGQEVPAPNWETHIDNRRPDLLTPQDPEMLKKIYGAIDEALAS